jgi:hypothetical protein
MKASRVLMFRYLAAVVVVTALLSAGGAVPVALGYYEKRPVEIAAAEARRAAVQPLPKLRLAFGDEARGGRA